MNEDPKEILNWMSPFQVYYGRKSHRLANQLTYSQAEADEPCRPRQKTLPSEKHGLLFENNCKKNRITARKATPQCKQQNAFSGKHKPSTYRMNDNVLVRVKTGNHKVGQKCIVIPGVVVQRNLKFHRYKVQFYKANSPSATQRWFIVSSITSVTCGFHHLCNIWGEAACKTHAKRWTWSPES